MPRFIAALSAALLFFVAIVVGGAQAEYCAQNVPITSLNATVGPAGTNPTTGNLYFGSGNPPTGFLQQRVDGVELNLAVIYRQGDTLRHPSMIDGCGRMIYRVPTGTQVVDLVHNVPVANPARAAWSINYAVVTPEQDLASWLQNHRLYIYLDRDQSDDTRQFTALVAVYDPAKPNGSKIVWKDVKTGTVVIGDDGGTSKTTQNSENIAFSFWLPSGYAYGPGIFSVELSAVELKKNKKGKIEEVPIAGIRSVVVVTPEMNLVQPTTPSIVVD